VAIEVIEPTGNDRLLRLVAWSEYRKQCLKEKDDGGDHGTGVSALNKHPTSFLDQFGTGKR
jgi:hypothetical protein